jgi:plasmid stability protein
MPDLMIADVPEEIFERIRTLAAAHNQSVSAEAAQLLREAVEEEQRGTSQADLLADLRRRSYTPPPGTPDSVALLREDRAR